MVDANNLTVPKTLVESSGNRDDRGHRIDGTGRILLTWEQGGKHYNQARIDRYEQFAGHYGFSRGFYYRSSLLSS